MSYKAEGGNQLELHEITWDIYLRNKADPKKGESGADNIDVIKLWKSSRAE